MEKRNVATKFRPCDGEFDEAIENASASFGDVMGTVKKAMNEVEAKVKAVRTKIAERMDEIEDARLAKAGELPDKASSN